MTSRRQFLYASGCFSLGFALPSSSLVAKIPPGSDPYKGLKTAKYLGEVKVETRIESDQVFTEGPAVDRQGNVYFTNIPLNQILKWDPESRDLSVFRDDLNAANGLRFHTNGDLLVCEGGAGRVVSIDMDTEKVSTLADSYQGKGLQSPNDLDFDAQGRIYFSSRSGEPDPEKENKRALYRVDPGGEVVQLLAEPEVHMPNGVVVSPDQKSLYLIEAHSGENKNRNILAFDLENDGSLSNRRTLYNFYPGRSGDGMCIDAKGNLYVAAGLHEQRGTSETLDTKPGIHVISPKGKLLAFRETPEDTVTNCTFGGADLKTLYITCRSYLLSIETSIPGKDSYLPD